MPHDRFARRQRVALHLLGLAAVCTAVSGCQLLGPQSLGAGRGAYNEVIARTSAEQTLGLIVRMRYADPIGLLTVSSVTANLQFGARAAGEAGIGSESLYAGNLVPFSAGISYEDNPTISYTPVDGEAFMTGWLTPVSLEALTLVLESGAETEMHLALFIRTMNGLRSGRNAAPSERTGFARAAALLAGLRDLGIAAWVQQPGVPVGYALVLSGYAPAHTAEVAELLALLDLPRDTRHGAAIVIPLALGVHVPGFDGLAIETRSVEAILRNASWDIEVPDEHVKAGVVAASAPMPSDGRPVLHIRSSRKAPSHADVAVRHRSYWYYVDDADLAGKRLFEAIQVLLLSRLSDVSERTHAPPVLTIPVK